MQFEFEIIKYTKVSPSCSTRRVIKVEGKKGKWVDVTNTVRFEEYNLCIDYLRTLFILEN